MSICNESSYGECTVHLAVRTVVSSLTNKRIQHIYTAWKVSKHGPEKTPHLDTFHVVLSAIIDQITTTLSTFEDFNDLDRYAKKHISKLCKKIVSSTFWYVKWLDTDQMYSFQTTNLSGDTFLALNLPKDCPWKALDRSTNSFISKIAAIITDVSHIPERIYPCVFP